MTTLVAWWPAPPRFPFLMRQVLFSPNWPQTLGNPPAFSKSFSKSWDYRMCHGRQPPKFNFCFFQTGFLSIALAVPELALEIRVPLPPGAGVKGARYHARHLIFKNSIYLLHCMCMSSQVCVHGGQRTSSGVISLLPSAPSDWLVLKLSSPLSLVL